MALSLLRALIDIFKTKNIKSDTNEENNMFDENTVSHRMNLLSRPLISLGVETLNNIATLKVLIIGLKGTGIETAKNLILLGVKNIVLHDEDIVQIADLGTNMYLNKNHVGKYSRSNACRNQLAQLNPYSNVETHKDNLSDTFIQSFDAVVITKTLPKNELLRINKLCRNKKNSDGKLIPSIFILAVTHGITGHIFSDFGPLHVINDEDDEAVRTFVVEDIDKDGIVTVAERRHGLDDGDMILMEEIEGEQVDNYDKNATSIAELNGLKCIKIKRMYYKYDFKSPTGKVEKRTRQLFNKFRLDLSDCGTNDLIIVSGYVRQQNDMLIPIEIIHLMCEYFHLNFEIKNLSRWINGGLITEIKKRKQLQFKSLSDCLQVPSNVDSWMLRLFGPQHPDQGAWERGAGKTIHLLYCTTLEFNEQKGYFPRLHNHNDSKEFMDLFKNINKINKESGIDGA
eukprot:49061_1